MIWELGFVAMATVPSVNNYLYADLKYTYDILLLD